MLGKLKGELEYISQVDGHIDSPHAIQLLSPMSPLS